MKAEAVGAFGAKPCSIFRPEGTIIFENSQKL